jgi:hypothetical protein
MITGDLLTRSQDHWSFSHKIARSRDLPGYDAYAACLFDGHAFARLSRVDAALHCKHLCNALGVMPSEFKYK